MSRFQSGGAVRANGLYVARSADTELCEALFAGEFCYVLAARQLGKSSLRLRTQERLRERGVRCVSIDLTGIGTAGVTPPEWYFSLIEKVARSLQLERDPSDFWAEHESLTPVDRFMQFLRREVLETVPEPVVISVDEIEVVLSLPFPRDDFFAAIRAVYNARAEDPVHERLTFCLFGLASPTELIEDASRTPFNVGRAVQLQDFTRTEAAAFLPGLEAAGGDARALLDAVLDWTSGHPYMTQRVCEELTTEGAEGRAGESERDRVDRVVQPLFLEGGRVWEPNLACAEQRLEKIPSGAFKKQIFRTYRRLLQGDVVVASSDHPAQHELMLAGMVSERREGLKGGGARLVIRNRIFAEVFNLRWVDENEANNPLLEPVEQWLRSAKKEDFVLRGAALAGALEWTRGREDIGAEEREFLQAGVQAAERDRAARQARRQRRISAVAFTGLLVVVAYAVLVTWALVMERRYKDESLMRLRQTHEEAERNSAEADERAREANADALEAREEAANQARRANELEKKRNAGDLGPSAILPQLEEANRMRWAAELREKEAKERAKQEGQIASEAKALAEQAAQALVPSAEAAALAQRALKTEQEARQLAEKQLRDAQQRLRSCQQDAVNLGKHTCWPE